MTGSRPVGSFGACGGRSCWKRTKTGFTYRNGAGTAGGITSVVLRTGTGKSLQVRGKGPALSSAPAGFPAPPLEKLQMQLQIDGGACFYTEHRSAQIRKNEPGRFTASHTPRR